MGGFDGLNPVFAARLQEMINAAAAEGRTIGIDNGLRTTDEQIALRQKNGCPDIWTAPASQCRIPTAVPRRSNHEFGLAADLTGDKAWANANGARFGLHFPVGGEDWHVELIDDDEAQGAVGPAQQRGAIGFDLEWQSPQRTPEDELGFRLDSIMGILTQDTPRGPENPEEMMEAAQLGTDVTVLPGAEPSTRTSQFGGGGGAVADDDKLGNARIIAQVGREMGLPDQAIKIGLAAALVESNLVNVNYGDRDSLGLFQQRPSQGWGSPEQVRDPYYAARKFFEGLSGVNWQGMDPGRAAQAVQRSAFPDRYGKRMGEAESIFQQIAGM